MNKTRNASDLLTTADLLLAGPPAELAVTWRRGAAFALRTALETAITDFLSRANPRVEVKSTKARLLCLRAYTAAETARRAHTAWHLLCLGCHYHQYDLGPTQAQLTGWRAEVEAVLTLLDS